MKKIKPQSYQHPEMTLFEHLLELRSRTLIYVLLLVVASGAGYYYYPQLVRILVRPLQQTLYYNSPVGGFQFSLNIAMFCGFVVTIPILTYQLLRFIEPVFPSRKRGFIMMILAASCVLVVLGVLTSYFLIIPATLHFLTSFDSETIKPLITVYAYFTFITWYLAAFALLFQMPLVMLLLSQFTPLTARTFLNWQRYVIVLCFVVSAILTPTPDIFNQCLFALPLLILYYVSILLVWATKDRREKKATVQLDIGRKASQSL